jgi:AbrB family looped-hinge helix DNA binding protein
LSYRITFSVDSGLTASLATSKIIIKSENVIIYERMAMAIQTSTEANTEIKTYPVRLRDRGQITVPQAVRDKLAVAEGDMLTLLQIGDTVLLTSRHLQTPHLADRIATLIEQEKVSLADLLAGLAEEREAIQRERPQNA